MKKLMPLLIVFMLLTACQQVPTGGSPAAPTPTLPPSCPETTSTLTPSVTETTPTETPLPTPTETPTPTEVEIQTFYKSEMYPWFGGIDMGEAKLNEGKFYLVDSVAWKAGYSGADLITENVLLAFAIQRGMSLEQYIAYLQSNGYKDTVIMPETHVAESVPMVNPIEVVLDFSKPMRIIVSDM